MLNCCNIQILHYCPFQALYSGNLRTFNKLWEPWQYLPQSWESWFFFILPPTTQPANIISSSLPLKQRQILKMPSNMKWEKSSFLIFFQWHFCVNIKDFSKVTKCTCKYIKKTWFQVVVVQFCVSKWAIMQKWIPKENLNNSDWYKLI